MKKLVYPVVVLLVALLAIGPMVSAASAMEPFAKPTELTEADRRGPPRRPPPPPRPRPAPRRDNHRGGGGNFAGSLIGSAIGGLIAGAIVHSNEPDVVYVEPAPPPVIVQPAPVYVQPAPPPVVVQPAQPRLVCDQYGNCWYEYR